MKKNISDISLVINARLNSTRVHHKLIRKFGDTTLLDNCLKKLEKINGVDIFLAASEKKILDIYDKYSNKIKILERSEKSVEKGMRDQSITFEHYKKVNTKYIMSVNPCCPFVKYETYEKAIDYFIKNNYCTMTSVKAKDNIFFDYSHKVINSETFRIATQGNKTIYEMSHLFHIFDRDFFIDNGFFWDYSPGHPALFVVDENECFDIDTEKDFEIGNILYDRI